MYEADPWFLQRFGVPAVHPGDLEGDARHRLALLLAEGTAPTLAEAVEAATKAAAAAAPDLPAAVPAPGATRPISGREVERIRKARATLQKLARLQKLAQAAAGEDQNAVPQYIYGEGCNYWSDGEGCLPSHNRWRILRVTPRFLFVDPSSEWIHYGEENWHRGPSQCDDLGRGAIRLPRDLTGASWRDRCRLAYWAPLLANDRDRLPPLTPGRTTATAATGWSPDRDLLGIAPDAPITLRALKAAYRRKAQTAHPDAGGSADAFRQLSEAFDRLSAAVACAAQPQEVA
jgi:hypothetical protein